MYENFLDVSTTLEKYDEQLAFCIKKELHRQKNNLELIASENIASPYVIATMGSILTNKYAEGYPKKRYYGGCEFVDEIENIAIERAKKLFNAGFANVQPHCGTSANIACYFALLKPGDCVLGLSLNDGGHLSHGSKINISGKYFNFVPYGLNDKTELIDYDELENLAIKNKPKLIVAGASSYPRIIDFEKISNIAKKVNSFFMVDIAHIAGLCCTGLHPNPLPFADVVTSTTHKTLRGPRGGLILSNNEEIAKKIDKAVFPGTQGGPLVHVIAAKAVCFKEASEEKFKIYQKNVIANAKELERCLLKRGFELVSGGTDNHLLLIKLKNFNITGKDLEEKLDRINITVNKNSIPKDENGPFVTSGIRIGTPAITTRGLQVEDIEDIAKCIFLAATNFENNITTCKNIVDKLTKKYPIY